MPRIRPRSCSFSAVLVLAGLFALVGISTPVFAQPGDWTPLGGPEGGTVVDLAASGGRVWAAAHTAGLFRSDDGAARWIRVQEGRVVAHQGSGLDLDPSWVRGEILALAADPSDRDTAYASTRITLLKTTDGGATWEPTGLTGDIEIIALAPSDPEIVYISTRSRIWRTDNGGETWRQADIRIAFPYHYDLTVDPRDPNTVFASTGDGVYRTTDGGRTWIRGEGFRFVEVAQVAVDPRDSSIVYAAARYGGVWKSVDRGLTWSEIAGFSENTRAAGLAFDPFSPGALYIAYNDNPTSSPADARSGKVARSLDGGATWTLLLTTEILHDLEFDAGRPGRLYVATDALGVLRSEDSGATWAAANTGLTAALVLRMTPDQQTEGVLYAAVIAFRQELFERRSLGVWKSTDGGATWRPVNAGLEQPSGFLPEVRELVTAPDRAGLLYVATEAGLFKTTDGGATWQRTTQYFSTGVRDVALDPRDSDVLYIVGNGPNASPTFGGGAKSTDGGQTWTTLPGLSGILLAVHVEVWNPAVVYIASSAGFWKSEDDGASWNLINQALTNSSERLTSGPVPGTLYDIAGFRLFGSTDGGAAWFEVQLPVEEPFQNSVFDLARGPVPASPLYVATRFGVFVLALPGTGWTQVGDEELWTWSVAVDPFTPSRVYAGTRDGLVYAFNPSASGTTCANTATTLCLEGRFAVDVSWSLPGGEEMAAHAHPVSDQSGSFWFFDPDLAEVLIKIVDGRPVNDHFWVFLGGMTNLGFRLRVTDTETGELRLYTNPAGSFLTEMNVEAFKDPGPPPPASLTTSPSGTVLTLASRFQAELTWRLGAASGVGQALPLGDSSGAFTIFDPALLEAGVKIFDGRPINGHFWVFFTSLTSAELTLEVTDRETGQVKTYVKPAGQSFSGVYMDAF